MKTLMLMASTLCVALVAVAGPPAVPATPAAVEDLVYTRTFTLQNGFEFDWSKERPLVTSGTLLVLKVDKALVLPRQQAEPVLYVGDHTAQRINSGYDSGYVIALVPGEVDLAKAPIWFGTPELPERIDAAKAKAERARAEAAGMKPFSAEKIAAASAKGGEQLNVASQYELLRGQVSDLIDEYSPQEAPLAETFRMPVTPRASE